jgi:hypothetical protein
MVLFIGLDSEGGGLDEEEGVRVSFYFTSVSKKFQRREAIKTVERVLKEYPISWIKVSRKQWIMDLDELKAFIPKLSEKKWFKGKISLEPEFEPEERIVFYKPRYDANLAFYIVPEDLKELPMSLEPPIEIKESLERIKKDYPDPTKVAFIMMQFGKTKAHEEIVKAIRTVLNSHGIEGIRADDQEYHDDLSHNVATYMYGCGMGIAVFERIEEDEFNPNVSLEVGYMFALKKPVCLLKDKTQKTIQADLVGKLYKSFDPQDPINSIPVEISKWLKDKHFIS